MGRKKKIFGLVQLESDLWDGAPCILYIGKIFRGDTTNVICNSAKQGLIPQREYFDKDIANSDNTSGYYIIEENDFVYNPRKSTDAPYGPISSYKYAEAGIVSPLYLCFRVKKEINPSFFEWYFRSSAWHRYALPIGQVLFSALPYLYFVRHGRVLSLYPLKP